jgi:DNA-binding transcriptional MerR regulator
MAIGKVSIVRPADLAREHGISTQAVRNYEHERFLPPAERTPSGYRIYTEVHAEALRAYLALVAAYGHSTGGRIMTAIHDGELDEALLVIDRGHHQLLRDRATLDSVRGAVDHLSAQADVGRDLPAKTRTVGELAHRLGVTPATVRKWEDAGILTPARDPATGYRVYDANDVRDAELTHLLRRGGYLLGHIASVVNQIRTAGGTESLSTASLSTALDDWRHRLTARGLAMLDAAASLSTYLRAIGDHRDSTTSSHLPPTVSTGDP